MKSNKNNNILQKETYILRNNKDILSTENINHDKTHKKINFIFNIFLYFSISMFILFLSYNKISTSISNKQIIIEDPFFEKEPLDDYNIEELNIDNNNNTKDILLKTLPNETFQKVINKKEINFLTEEIIKTFNKFTKICYKGKLIDNNKYPLLKNPKITVTIPIYNGGKYLYYSLRSIQNQKMKEIEIILIDDNSNDNTLEIIEKYMKEDERIRLIKNTNNRKILYSKSIGALNANGKYILQLDQDDMFIRDDIFDILYNEAEKFELDLVQMRDFVKNSFFFNQQTIVNIPGSHIINPKETHYKYQPELKNTMFREGNNYLLWGMLIKTDLYKKAIYNLWEIIINYKITYQEDYMVTFILIILANKYKYLNNFGLIHLTHSSATSTKFKSDDEFYFNILFVANKIYEYSAVNYYQEIYIIFSYITYFQYYILSKNNRFQTFTNFILKKIFDNENLPNEYKNYMKKTFNLNDEKDFQIWNGFYYMSNYIEEYKKIFDFYDSKVKEYKIKTAVEPLISIIITCYEFKYLDKTINSIENQNFIYFEIILIYDNDEEGDLYLIKEYINNFHNIRLIVNYEKKGLIYSYSKGILSSNGKYVLILEPSNTLATEDTLKDIFNEIHYDKIDILEFNILINNREKLTKNSLNLYRCQHFKSIIDMSKINYNNSIGIDIRKELLINKLIKSDIMKKISQNFKNIERIIFNYYDNIFLYLLQKGNYIFKHIGIFGVIQNIKNPKFFKVNSFLKEKNQHIKDSIFYINFIFEKSNNTFEEKDYVYKEFNNLLSIIYNKFNRITKESYTLYKKFMECNYISKYNKMILQFYCTSLMN